MAGQNQDAPDTYETMREMLEDAIKEQTTESEKIASLLNPNKGTLRGSHEDQLLKARLRSWFNQQRRINERVAQILTLLDSRIGD